MALLLVEVGTKAGALLQDLRDNRCHHHSGVPTMVALRNSKVMAHMVRYGKSKLFINGLISCIQ
jgi:hypothetical protein